MPACRRSGGVPVGADRPVALLPLSRQEGLMVVTDKAGITSIAAALPAGSGSILFWVRLFRSVATVRENRNGVRPISGAQNEATAMAFGGPRSSCARPGAHSARHRDSHNDWTPCRMVWPFGSAGAHALDSDETLGPTPSRGRRTPLVAYAPSLSCAPPMKRRWASNNPRVQIGISVPLWSWHTVHFKPPRTRPAGSIGSPG